MKTPIIAHLSDLHIHPRYFPERSARLHQTLSECRDRNVGHVVITGDLSHLGQVEELEECASILRRHGYWDSSRLTVTIGNHDIFGGPYLAEDVLTFPGNCRDTDYEAKVNTFRNIFSPAFESTIPADNGAVFPFVKLIGSVALIGINTVAHWKAVRNPLGSNGDVDEVQYEQLARMLGDRRLHDHRIFALTHHHFHTPKYLAVCSLMEKVWQRIEGQTLKLWNRKRLLDLLKAHGVEKILHGHVHEHSEYRADGLLCHNAGASMLPVADQPRKFHIINPAPPDSKADTWEHRKFIRPPKARAGLPRFSYSA
jgi:predicted phosphodiesterase